jgi:hypothetical protein
MNPILDGLWRGFKIGVKDFIVRSNLTIIRANNIMIYLNFQNTIFM